MKSKNPFLRIFLFGDISIKLETKNFENSTAGATWRTRGDAFYLSGTVFYN